MKKLCLLFWFLASLACAQAQTYFVIASNGPPENRINVTFFGDGYTAGSQQQKFTVDAANGFNAFLNQPVWAPYKHLFNAQGVATVSAEEGSDHPNKGIYKDTYFSSTFYTSSTERLLTIPPNNFDYSSANGSYKVSQLVSIYAPQTDLKVVLCNDSMYGGSGGGNLISSLNSSAAEIVKHESGHTFARLGDEYTTAYPGYSSAEEPNTTRETNRTLIKWLRWIDPTTPIPTPNSSTYASKVGLFEGAHYNTKGWYRPWYNCLMNNLGMPLCPVCAEQMIVSMYSKLIMIDARYPVSTNVVVGAENSFAVEPIIPAPLRKVEWKLNGVTLDGETDSFVDFDRTNFLPGTNTLSYTAWDTNTMLRVEIKAQTSWIIINNDEGTPPAPPILKLIKRVD